MKGNNVLYLNEATIMGILEEYFNSNSFLTKDKVVVTTVAQSVAKEHVGTFKIVFSPVTEVE